MMSSLQPQHQAKSTVGAKCIYFLDKWRTEWVNKHTINRKQKIESATGELSVRGIQTLFLYSAMWSSFLLISSFAKFAVGDIFPVSYITASLSISLF